MNYREILRNLVAFPTVSSDSNLALIDYVRDWLESCGFTTRCQYNAEGDKANLIARLGPERDGGILLAGHTDVVPVADQDWNSDPFLLA
ncbi:MAG: hypothetical protein IBX71_05155 [Candidatus Desulforudis sp.]|nr:hypothetical protein [Desulforudis sp.]